MLLGFSPDRLAFLNALVASGLGAIAGILLSAIAGASPTNYSFFVVPALAGALAGRLRYLLPTVVVALGARHVPVDAGQVERLRWGP